MEASGDRLELALPGGMGSGGAVVRVGDTVRRPVRGWSASVDAFLDDFQLYSYAMKAYGLEDMIYAKAFMRKVLESDMSDANSFANKLTDVRYQDFASAFSFSAACGAK